MKKTIWIVIIIAIVGALVIWFIIRSKNKTVPSHTPTTAPTTNPNDYPHGSVGANQRKEYDVSKWNAGDVVYHDKGFRYTFDCNLINPGETAGVANVGRVGLFLGVYQCRDMVNGSNTNPPIINNALHIKTDTGVIQIQPVGDILYTIVNK